MIRNLVIFLLFCCPIASWANTLPEQLAVPGGVVKMLIADIETQAPEVFFHNNRVLVTANKTHWIALIGIPLAAKSGIHQVRVQTNNKIRQQTFTIEDKDYPTQHISIKKKRMVTGFTPADLRKINADKKAMDSAKATWTKQNINIDFMLPVTGRISSLFGLKRFFNDIPKRPHNGLDIAAPIGTPIIAPASAKVIDVGNYYFNGNTVFLDHGQGLLSAYMHLNEIKVASGQLIKQGEMLGTVGETGRATGPHLHWMIYLNKVAVDPALFVAKAISSLNTSHYK